MFRSWPRIAQTHRQTDTTERITTRHSWVAKCVMTTLSVPHTHSSDQWWRQVAGLVALSPRKMWLSPAHRETTGCQLIPQFRITIVSGVTICKQWLQIVSVSGDFVSQTTYAPKHDCGLPSPRLRGYSPPFPQLKIHGAASGSIMKMKLPILPCAKKLES